MVMENEKAQEAYFQKATEMNIEESINSNPKTTHGNQEKYETYRALKTNLRKAMRDGFYYQAIFIEYAIIEDRCESVLRHAGVKTTTVRKNGNEQEIKLDTKLNRMKSRPEFTTVPYVKKRITAELIEDLRKWKDDRNDLVHKLANLPYDYSVIKETAERGEILVNKLDNKVKSVNTYFTKTIAGPLG